MTRVFLDSDVMLDFLLGRELFSVSAGMIFAHAETGKIELCTSTVAFLNVHYIAETQRNKAEARKLAIQLESIVSLLPVSPAMVSAALRSGTGDLEDAVQYQCALENKVDFLVTRNVKDYPKKGLPVMTPDVFLGTIPQSAPQTN